MSIQSRLGKGEELQSNCKLIRLSTAWEINNPAGWQVNNSVLGASSAKGAVFYSGFNNQLFLMDSTDFSQHINGTPTVVYRPSYYAGLFYNGKPVASTSVSYPPEWEYGKAGPFLTINNYGDNFLGGSVENTPVPTFRLIGPAIATTDLSFSHGVPYANSFVNNGRYDCDWVLGPGPREFPEIRGNPGPSPEPREPRHREPPDEEEKPETKNLDFVSIFFFLEETNGSPDLENRDYGNFSYLAQKQTGRDQNYQLVKWIDANATVQTENVPSSLLKSHGLTFLPDARQIVEINENDFSKYKSKTDLANKTYYGMDMEAAKTEKSLVISVPFDSKIWSYSALPK